MKKVIFLLSIFTLLGCEEVIDLKLDNEQKQLVVDAAIDWEKGAVGNEQKVILSYTTDFYATQTAQRASGATVEVTTSNNVTYAFTETNAGEYVCTTFSPQLGEEYSLSIEFEGKKYTSKSRMYEVPTLTESNITQRENGGISGKDKEIRLTFDTSLDQENNFIIKKTVKGQPKKDGMYAIDDKFFINGKMSIVFSGRGDEQEYQTGDEVEFTLYRVSSQYKQLMDLLLNISLQDSGGGGAPMFSTPSRIKGNITYEPNPKENPLGAFRVSQYCKITYTVK